MKARLRVFDPTFTTERGLLPFVAETLAFSTNVDGDGDITFDALRADVDTLAAWVCGLNLELETTPGVWTVAASYSPRHEFTGRVGSRKVTLTAQETLGVWARETLIMPEAMSATVWPTMPDDREMGWMASAYDPAEDQFGEPWALCDERDYTARPKGWPAKCPAKWITAGGNFEDYQRKYFRGWLTVPPRADGQRQNVRIYMSAEESTTVYVAGSMVIDEEFREGEWRNKYRARTISLRPGTYAVGMVSDSAGGKKSDGGFWGTDPNLFAAGLQGANGTITQWLMVSNQSTFRACRRTDDPTQPAGRPPGPTPGQVLDYIIGEAKRRWASGWRYTSFGFTDAADSYGVPWAECVTERQWRVGDHYFDIIQALSETGDLDMWLDPAEMVVHAAPKRGQHRPGKVWTGDHLADLNERGSGHRGTWVMGETAHSHWYSRWTSLTDRREYVLTMGQATSRWTADRILDASLRDAWRWDGTGKLRPPKPGWEPFVDYWPGDWMDLDYQDVQTGVVVQELAGTSGEGGLLWEVSFTEYPPPVVDTVAR